MRLAGVEEGTLMEIVIVGAVCVAIGFILGALVMAAFAMSGRESRREEAHELE